MSKPMKEDLLGFLVKELDEKKHFLEAFTERAQMTNVPIENLRYVENQIHILQALCSLVENMDKKVSRKKLAKLAGEFSTLNFSGIHPEEVLEWLIEKFTELGLEVEEKEVGGE